MIGVYSAIPLEPSGCFYYRVHVPLRGIQDAGLGQYYVDTGRGLTEKERAIAAATSDIVLFYASTGDAVTASIKQLKAMKSGFADDGTTVIHPPSLVFDMDDNLDFVHPFNHAFVRLGTRNWDGEKLNPGDDLMGRIGDETFPIWEDKKTKSDGFEFNIAMNHATVQNAHMNARLCDDVTVPSTHLMEYYRDELGVKNLYQYPNSVIPGDYPKAQLAPRTDGKVRILWQGGGSHMPDWFPLRDAVREVCVRYPQAVFVIWGTNFRWIHDNIPDGQIEFVNWVGYDGYKAYRTLIDADINLCPLVNNIFNRGKSCIKWYEGSILSRPEATLAANERPYSEEMVDGETGLLYDHPDEFVQKLGALIESAELRQRLGENAKKWVLENRLYTKTAVGLHEFYQELRARKERESLLEV
jgi:glycosyltransferase involved in cell wall biosynthesis